MRVTLCGEPGAPLICPGRQYGSYETSDDCLEDERSLAQTPERRRPVVSGHERPLAPIPEPHQSIFSEKEQIIYWSGWKPSVTNIDKPKIKAWMNEKSTPMQGDETFITPYPLEISQHMLQKVRELHGDRYDAYLDSHPKDTIVSSMVALLRPEAWKVLCSREYTREK